MSIFIIFILYSLPHFFMTIPNGNICVPYAKGMDHLAGKVYYWLDIFIGFGFPFVALLLINSVSIHTLCERSSLLLTKAEPAGPKFNKIEKFSKTNHNNVASCHFWVFNFDVSFLWYDILHYICRFQQITKIVCWLLSLR